MTPLITTIPADVRAAIADRLAVEVGFGAGPGCIGVKLQRLDPPVELALALAWLEGYRSTMRRGHVTLDDGSVLFFDPDAFRRLAAR